MSNNFYKVGYLWAKHATDTQNNTSRVSCQSQLARLTLTRELNHF